MGHFRWCSLVQCLLLQWKRHLRLITPPGQTVTDWNYHRGARHKFAQGDEVGRFQYGSTVITLIPNSMAGFHAEMTSEAN